MCARTSEKYKEEVCGLEKEEKLQRQLLDAVFNLQPRIVLRRADIIEKPELEWQQPVSPHIKEEGEEVKCIKEGEEEFLHMKEEKQEEIIQVPSTGVYLKNEEGQSEERRRADPPRTNSSSDGDHCGGSQTDDDDEQSEGIIQGLHTRTR
ncbi:uncharacterized protein LOC133493816 isoform X3 [Syngnathoides biaculeatus]|uniref:uncharacterized protein LOC133493816 isoform X3 n=1 Tax=Syngnathoides biaculeatus TaxID=300417 RepID=UPI002ADDB8E5|nr:uncharacterized protein LOC133493816 isoform X3 [Syngnathoides biaculeatus]